MTRSVIENTLLSVAPWLIYPVAGIFFLSTGKGVPPGQHKYVFGMASFIAGIAAWLALRTGYQRWRGLSAKQATVRAASLLLSLVVLGVSYAALLERCVITDKLHGTWYYPMWSTGQLAEEIAVNNGRRGLTAAYGPADLDRLITQMPGYSLAIATTTLLLLALLQGAFLSASGFCVLLVARSPVASEPPREQTKTTLLFLAANPQDTDPLRLDREYRAIEQQIRLAEFRDRFDLKQHWAVRASDLQGYLLMHRPDILHFSGHGSSSSEIILEDDLGNSQPVSPRALSQLFSIFNGKLRCVVLNACYSEQQAKAIAEHVEYVVGMSNAITDVAAISFAAAFYQALGYGEKIETAFDLACNQIDLENLGEQDTPKLLTSVSSQC